MSAKTISDCILDHAVNFADRPALVCFGVTAFYSELDRLADKFANHLGSAGCQKGDLLGIQLPSAPQYVEDLIAAFRLGMKVTSVSVLLTPPDVIH